MNVKDFKLWEWAVAALVVLLSIVSLTLAITDSAATLPFSSAAGIVTAIVLLWSLWCIRRMALLQDRKASIFLVFFIIYLLFRLFLLLSQPLHVAPNVSIAVQGVFGVALLVCGIVATVQLFHDGVKPLGTIMVLYILLPILLTLLIPFVARPTNAIHNGVGLLIAALVALMFLFRNAPGQTDEE